MLVDLRLRDSMRSLAFTRSDQQEPHIRVGPMHQRCCLEQRRNSFLPCHPRDSDDNRGRAKIELFAKLPRGRGVGQGPFKPFDIHPTAAGWDHQAIFARHSVTFEKGLILVRLKHSGRSPSGGRAIHRATYRTSG